MLNITKRIDAQDVPFDIDGKIMHSDRSMEIIHLTLASGEKLDLHDNPNDVVFYMLEGSAFLIFGDEETEIRADSCFRLEKRILRGWINRGTTKARLLVIKQL